jgi:hypothetical protein
MKIAILGSGISGLLAASGCIDSGVNDITIYSKSLSKPQAFGFQYLHDPCNLPLESEFLYKTVVPSNVPLTLYSDLYSIKVYGTPGVPNSMDSFDLKDLSEKIWDMNKAIDILWGKFSSKINYLSIQSIDEVKGLSDQYDLVFSSVPLSLFKECKYTYSYVSSFKVKPAVSYVVYDVSPGSQVYRYGRVFGQFFVESTSMVSDNSVKVVKVIEADNTKIDFPDNVLPIGRYSTWWKGMLAHDAYRYVCELLK